MRGTSGDAAMRVIASEVNPVASFDFTLILDPGPSGLTDALVEELCEAGLDDALVGESAGTVFADVTRTATTLLDAVLSAITDVQKVGSVQVVRVKPADLPPLADVGLLPADLDVDEAFRLHLLEKHA